MRALVVFGALVCVACTSPTTPSGAPLGGAPEESGAPAPAPAPREVPREEWKIKDLETAKRPFAGCRALGEGLSLVTLQEASPAAPVWVFGISLPDHTLLDRCYVDALSQRAHCAGDTCLE